MNACRHRACSPRRLVPVSMLSAVLAAVSIGSCVTAVRAGEQGVSCEHPRVWSGAAVNAVVRPYQYTGRDDRPLSRTARELTLLTHTNVLFSMLKYGGVGAVTLTTRGVAAETVRTECDPDTVMAKIMGQTSGAESQIGPGRGVVLLWGFVYEEGDDVYVQSYVRFLRRDDPDRIALTLDGGEAGKVVLAGGLTDQAVAFAPRQLTAQTLKAIAGAFHSTAKIHVEPSKNSGTVDVVMDPDVQLSYRITDAQAGWMRIESTGGGIEGWIQAEPSLGDKRLDQQLPEIHFVEALVGYMRYRIALDGTAEYGKPGSLAAWTRKAVERFEQGAGKKRAAAPAAMARILLGNLAILSADRESMLGAVRAAADEYERAVELAPYSAAARNLDAMARIYLGQRAGWSKESPQDVAVALQEALALDPSNTDVTANLEGLFTLISGLPESTTGIDKEQLERKLAAVKRVRAHQADR